jgi:hypothetical protein
LRKIVLTKKTSAIFLVTVLVAGIIASISSSFMTVESAQAQPYSGRDNRYNSYEPYSGMNNNDRKSYGKDNYESQYQPSHKPDYKLQYPSYDKDNNIYQKSKDAGIIGLRTPPGIEICFDRIDNDGDGLRDFRDPDCPTV